jgi:hypothetical protein
MTRRSFVASLLLTAFACSTPPARRADTIVDSGTDAGPTTDAGPPIDAGPCGPMPAKAPISFDPHFDGTCATECPAYPNSCIGHADSNETCYKICGNGGCCTCNGTQWSFRSVGDCWPPDAGRPADAGTCSGSSDGTCPEAQTCCACCGAPGSCTYSCQADACPLCE